MKQNLTPKQQKIVLLLKRELSNKNFSKSFGELMIEAGYSQTTSRLPSEKVLDSKAVQDEMSDFIAQLDEKARMALRLLTQAKVEGSNARDIGYLVDILTKNKQLLSGHDTERKSIKIEISEEIAKKNT